MQIKSSLMKLKSLINKQFIVITLYTASACILFLILYARKNSTILTRTLSCIVMNPINGQEINEFLDAYEKPRKVEVRLKNIEMISYEERVSIDIIFFSTVDDEFVEKLKSDFEKFFQNKIITKSLLKLKKLPQACYDATAGVFVIKNTNEVKQKIPIFISLSSISVTSEGLKVFNASKRENSDMAEVSSNLRILILGFHDKHNAGKDISLLAIKDDSNFIFIELVDAK